MSALQSQTYANSGEPYYGNPAEWYKFPSLNDKIEFGGTDAVIEVIPAVPDANTTITFNGNQLAYVSDVPNLENWAQYPANHDVDIPAPYALNVSTMNNASANISTLYSQTGTISTLTVSTLNYSFSPIGNISTLLGPTVSITADQGLFTTSPSEVSISTFNGSYGKISMTANPGQLNTLGGQVNVTANGGNSLGGLFGAVNIVANQGTDLTTGITTGGEINITANSGTGLGTATSAININSGGINSYAGFGTPIASLYGYNFINGTAGVSLCASVVPNSAFQVPGTCYLYGDTGITLGSDTYGTRFFPYWNGLTAPPNLLISGRTTIAGNAEVCLSNVSSINGASYPPPGGGGVGSLNTLTGALTLASADNSISVLSAGTTIDLAGTRNPEFSTITMKSVDVLTGEGTINGGALSALANQPLIITGGRSDPDYSLINMGVTGIITINGTNAEGLTNGEGIVISKEGATLTFPTFTDKGATFGCGEIFNLSTINGVAYNPGGGGSYPPNANFSTITMNESGTISANSIFNTTANDLNISQENVAGSLALNVSPGGTGLVGQVNINTAGTISFNQLVVGSGIQINPDGNELTFIQSATPADQGQIVGLSTINGVAYVPGGGGSYPPNANFSTITMNPDTGIINANGIINPDTNGNDFTISQQNATGLFSLTVAPSAGPTVGDITINNAGSISFNEITAGSGIQINPEGNLLTFLQSATPADQGQIIGLSTINGVAYSSSSIASLNALTGALSLTATEGTVVITPSSPNINLYVPSAPYTLSGTTAGATITNRVIGSGNPFPSNTFTQATEITFNIPPGWTATDSVSYDGYAFYDFSANFNSFWGVSYITNTFATPTDILGSTTNTANALNYPNNQQIYLPLNLIVPPTYLSAGGTITFRIFCNPTSTNHYIISTPINTAKISIVRD